MTHPIISRPLQSRFLDVPQTPLAYWLSERFFDLLSGPCFGQIIVSKEGITTTDNDRFIRYVHESPIMSDWRPVPKGGGYCKWFGLNMWTMDWRDSGSRLFSIGKATMRNLEYWGREGYTYTQVARGGLGTHKLLPGTALEHKGPAIFVHNESEGPIDLLNSRTASFLLRVMNQGMEFRSSTIERVPTPIVDDLSLRLASHCLHVKQRLVSLSPIEATFLPTYSGNCPHHFALRASVYLHSFEAASEWQIATSYGLDETDIQCITDETGTPSGWFPLIEGYDNLAGLDGIGLDDDTCQQMQELLSTAVDFVKRCLLDPAELDQLRWRLRSQYEADPGGTIDQEHEDVDAAYQANDDDDDSVAVGARIAIPAETFLEVLSERVEIHPVSVYWLLIEGIEKESWRCLPEERRLWGDRVTVAVLRLLGHRWPKQVEANEPVPDWSDADGIIPLTPLINKSTLSERVQRRLSADEIGISDFAEVMGKPLDAWLATEFFKHHTKQFKKRPIAWQVQSGSFTTRSTPAIACLIYYHKLDNDLLPKVRKLAEDLRKSRETELRGIMSIAQETLSDRQETRRVELEDAITELQRFDATLETVATTGFGPESLRPKLRQYALNDAMLAIKVRWLRRLSELVATGSVGDGDSIEPRPSGSDLQSLPVTLPDGRGSKAFGTLRNWLKAATQANLHPDLGSWITTAMSHLDHHCAQVGPQAPDQSDLETDPTAVELAAIIVPQAASMQAKALSLGCDVWWKVLDNAVFAPVKEQIKQLKAEQKECEATLKSEPEPDEATTRKLKARVKELKAEVKSLDKDLKEQTTKAKKVREQIEAWKSDDPATWGNWLAKQPMFDQISSLDHRRPAPKTIAEFIAQESLYAPDINDGVRVNIAPLQKAGILAADVLAAKDLDKAIADRAEWRADERRWVRERKLPQPGWWPESLQ